MKNLVIAIVVIGLVIVGIRMFTGGEEQAVNLPTEGSTDGTAAVAEQITGETGAVREFTVTGKNFSFDPSTITVKKGDMVKITFVNAGGFHDFTVDGLNVATPRINTGEQATVEFTAGTAGSFEYFCSVGDHRAKGMKGMLIVTE